MRSCDNVSANSKISYMAPLIRDLILNFGRDGAVTYRITRNHTFFASLIASRKKMLPGKINEMIHVFPSGPRMRKKVVSREREKGREGEREPPIR
jgi:hypothetical protein